MMILLEERSLLCILAGVAGDFTAEEVELLERCIPDGVAYVESDAQVIKAEGPQPLPNNADRLPVITNEDAFPTVRVKSTNSENV